ncbi:MAG: abortive infection protein, partial [Nitrosomonas sp.]|nr:abortive infection protein [Nitrosomonas sp.]
MTTILSYLREYASTIDEELLLFSLIWTGILITLNYTVGIENELIQGFDSRFDQLLALFLVYCCAFVIPYLFAMTCRKHLITVTPMFWLLLLIAPALFALKVSVANPLENSIDGIWGSYVTSITTLPFKFLVVLIPLVVLYKILPVGKNFWGMTLRNVQWRPYCLMLALMAPLIIFASTQPDFLSAYPRLRQVAFIVPYTENPLWYQFLYEISYGIDFITIELFFRGFLVFAFVRYAGPSAILPMATFY